MFTSGAILLATVACVFAGPFKSGYLTNLQSVNLDRVPYDESWAQGKSVLLGSADDVEANACTSTYSCADCKTAQICRPTANGFAPIKTIKCPDESPFCDYSSGTCTTLPNGACGETDDFICLEDGHFPDPDCTIYHVCQGLKASKFACAIKGQTYNADSQMCETSNSCSKMVCDNTGRKVQNDLYPSYYAYCDAAKAVPVVIDRCEGINRLNVTSQLCEPMCEEEGVLQDIEDCTKYYKCHYIWIDEANKFLIKERMDCPPNTGFDPNNYMCVTITDTSYCKKK